MNAEEQIAETYLKLLDIGDVKFEPNGNIPPDFSINGYIGVEVRRLNQHFTEGTNAIGLEVLEIPIWDAFIEVLRSFEKGTREKSFGVGLIFQRPLKNKIKDLKPLMKNALISFLETRPKLPCTISVNDQVKFLIFVTEIEEDELFLEAGSADSDAGGPPMVQKYIENIRHCIKEKSMKIKSRMPRYEVWWLILVDTIEWPLKHEEIKTIIANIIDIGNFDELVIVNQRGKLFFMLSKQ